LRQPWGKRERQYYLKKPLMFKRHLDERDLIVYINNSVKKKGGECMKKGIYVMFFICICMAVSVVFPRLSTPEEKVDHDSSCLGCHVNGEAKHDVVVLHNTNHFIPEECANCHEGGVGAAGNVSASACLACHPAENPGPGTNADKCDLMELHEGSPDYDPAPDPSCFSSTDCHLNQCNGASTTTTTTQATTSQDGGSCPSEEIYGEGSLEVTLLRAVRDRVLSQTPEGREIIKLYYQWSPVVTMALRNDKAFKKDMKELLDGILSLTVD
jgi:hypothetical protein